MSGFGRKKRYVKFISIEFGITAVSKAGKPYTYSNFMYEEMGQQGESAKIKKGMLFDNVLTENPQMVTVLSAASAGDVLEIEITTAERKGSVFHAIHPTDKPFGTFDVMLEAAAPSSAPAGRTSAPSIGGGRFDSKGMIVGNAVHGASRIVSALINKGLIDSATAAYAALDETVKHIVEMSTTMQEGGDPISAPEKAVASAVTAAPVPQASATPYVPGKAVAASATPDFDN